MKTVIYSALLGSAAAFPFVPNAPGVHSPWTARSSIKARQQAGEGAGGEKQCPYNAHHVPAAPITAKYPYNGAINGKQGNQKGGILVPAKGDTAHYFVAPNPKTDIRGPCPGLNAAANHNFLAHDGVTTFNELVDAQQNVYNVGYDLALLLATLGLTLTDGDIVTEKLSIGCDATSRTSYNPTLTGHEPGLDGHNKFEADSSLTRNDFFLNKGNDFTYNGTLFGMMTKTTGGNFDFNGMALYRYQRYMQSRAENEHFFFGPLALLLYGAASFLYELMPGGPDYKPDLPTISSFFGAVKNKDGTWGFNNHEQIPPNWTTRLTPYSNNDVTNQILTQYLAHPVLFGGNTGSGAFDTISFGSIQNGSLPADLSPTDTSCLLYQLATGSVPSYLNGLLTPTVAALDFVLTKLGPQFNNLGCPVPET